MIRTYFFAAMAATAWPFIAAAQEVPRLEGTPVDDRPESHPRDAHQTRTFRVRHTAHDTLARTLEGLSMPEGANIVSVAGAPNGGEYLVTVAGAKEALEEIESMLKKVEREALKDQIVEQRFEAVRLGRADGSLALRVLQTFMKGAPNFRVELDAQGNTLLLYGTEEELQKAREVVDAIADAAAEPREGSEREIKVFEIQHADARELAELIKTVLSDPTLAIGVDRRTNTIVASGAADDLKVIGALLLTLDQPSADTSGGAADTDDLTPSAVEPAVQDAEPEANARLKDDYETAEQEVLVHRNDFRRWKEAGNVPDQVLEEQRNRIKAAVEEAFEMRQRLQLTEVERLQERLNTIERRVQRREVLKDRIIERRLAELLGESDSPRASGLTGPVEIEQFEPHDYLILRGGAADVERVMETLKSLEGKLTEPEGLPAAELPSPAEEAVGRSDDPVE